MTHSISEMKSSAGELYRSIPHINAEPVFFFADGAPCCNECAHGENDSEAGAPWQTDDEQWTLVAYDAACLYDDTIICEHCGREVGHV